MSRTWSNPSFYGISHLGQLQDVRRATIRTCGDLYILSYWTRGEGFSPPERTFTDLDKAKASAVRWIDHAIIGESE